MLVGKALYPHLSDPELFQLMKQNDCRAFEALYNRHWPSLINDGYKRLKSREKAEDIVQNIFTDLYQRRSTVNLTISLKAYLNQALKFKILNEYRANAIRVKHQKALFFSDFCKNDLAEEIEAKELNVKFQKALNNLPEKCKQVFVLSRYEDMSNRDISKGINISISTVEKHISKALKTFRYQI